MNFFGHNLVPLIFALNKFFPAVEFVYVSRVYAVDIC